MNFIRLKRANWVVVMAMLALPGALMTSCSKETNPTEQVEPKGDKLVISVKGVNIPKPNTPLKQGLSPKTTANSAVAAPTVYEFADVDMAVSVGNNLPVKTVNTVMGGGRSGLAADASTQAVEAIEAGVKYVIYIYEGNTFVTSVLLEAGTAGTIEGLNPQGSYTWVALSHNDGTDAPAVTPAAVDVALPENTDVLYASGNIDLATSNTIDITFDHVYSRIGIELNTIGVFGDITGTPAVSVSGLNIAGGSLNLLNGTLTANTTTFDPELTYADFVNVDESYDDAMIAYVYTAPVAAQNVQLKLQNLEISHADGSIGRTYFTAEATLSLDDPLEPESGQSHHLLFNVVESPLTTNYDNQEVKWGRSNLYYRNNGDALRSYAFYANNAQASRADGYFGFGGTVAGTFATTSTEGDPCALVYPAGLWKQPSKADFNGLVRGDIELGELTAVLGPLGQAVDATGITGIIDLLTNLLGNAVATLVNRPAPNATLSASPFVYGQYAISDGAPASGENAFGDANSASNNLRFYYNGQIADVTVLSQLGNGGGLIGLGLNDLSVDLLDQNIINLGVPLLDSYGDFTSLWTDQQGTDILGLAGAGSWAYMGNAGRGIETNFLGIPTGFNARFHMANNTGELLNGVEALGLDVLSTTLKNVRCVRAN